MKSINETIREVRTAAATSIGEALINCADDINTAFDQAYACCTGGHYASGMANLADGLKALDELLEYADSVVSTADGSEYEWVRDSLGSINMEKAPCEEKIREHYSKQISWYVSPGFGTKPRCVICWYDNGKRTADRDFCNFRKLRDENRLDKATMYWNGAAFDYENGRWVVDCMINPVSRPDLKEYTK